LEELDLTALFLLRKEACGAKHWLEFSIDAYEFDMLRFFWDIKRQISDTTDASDEYKLL